MKKSFSSIVLAAFLTAAPAFAQPSATAQGDDKAQIGALFQRFAAAFRHKDLDAIMSVYVHDNSLFVFDANPPRQHVGWNDYRADWKGFFGEMNGNPKFSISDLDFTTDGTIAYGHSIQSVTVGMGRSPRQTVIVRVTDVLQKVNGKWLIVQEHVSIPFDFEKMKPDLLSK